MKQQKFIDFLNTLPKMELYYSRKTKTIKTRKKKQMNNKFKKNTGTEYVWMLKNKTTGQLYPSYTYKTRESARKATRSASGRFKNFSPVKVYKNKPTAKVAAKATYTLGSSSGKGFNSRKGFGLWLVGSRRK